MSVKEIRVNREPSFLEDFLRREELRKLDFKERKISAALKFKLLLYKGKDEKDYQYHEDMVSANKSFLQQQYPTTFPKFRVR